MILPFTCAIREATFANSPGLSGSRQDKSASRYTLVSLSEQCGFSSRTSFFRSFKKFKGMSPAEYIKEHGIFIE